MQVETSQRESVEAAAAERSAEQRDVGVRDGLGTPRHIPGGSAHFRSARKTRAHFTGPEVRSDSSRQHRGPRTGRRRGVGFKAQRKPTAGGVHVSHARARETAAQPKVCLKEWLPK